MSDNSCNYIKKDGKKCSMSAKINGYCKRHNIKEPVEEVKKPVIDEEPVKKDIIPVVENSKKVKNWFPNMFNWVWN